MTVRPLESLDFGPVGLHAHQCHFPSQVVRTTYPTRTRRFSFSSSSAGVVAATSGSGVHSSTNSSISWPSVSAPFPLPCPKALSYLLCELDLLLCTVAWAQHVAHCKQEQKQLNCATHRVVLVAALYVPQDDGRAGHSVELRVCVVVEANKRILGFLEIHGGRQTTRGLLKMRLQKLVVRFGGSRLRRASEEKVRPGATPARALRHPPAGTYKGTMVAQPRLPRYVRYQAVEGSCRQSQAVTRSHKHLHLGSLPK